MPSSSSIEPLYFLGIGGIGMSALARWFAARGCRVEGYDRTPSSLTRELEKEGIRVIYTDSPEQVADMPWTMVWTPAVPKHTALYQYFEQKGARILKRSEMLGRVTEDMRALCVAGTHGKTSTAALLAHILRPQGVNAFLGGISMNEGSNLITDSQSNLVVVEADEFDRSFLHLKPAMSVITAIDPDHLDIYGTPEGYQEGFEQYARLVKEALVIRKGYHVDGNGMARLYQYSVNEPSDFYSDNIRITDGRLLFDWHAPDTVLTDVELGVPVLFNVENATAAMAVASLAGANEQILRQGVQTYKGVLRRFNIHVRTNRITYIDDYAHHPQELMTAIRSARQLYPERYLIGVFQPHLYTRTRDFMDGFAAALGALDEAVLLPIYPAREEPIEGVTSEALADRIHGSQPVRVVQKTDMADYVCHRLRTLDRPVTVLTLGAGDIDRLVDGLTAKLKETN